MTHASAASHNNHWGVPLSLARLPRDADFGVFELGMNHPGEIARLTAYVRPHVALITLIAPAHLGFFSSLEGIAAAKAEIFDGLEPGGTAVLNRDDDYFDSLRVRAEPRTAAFLTYGVHPAADWRLVDARLDEAGSDVVAVRHGRALAYRIGTPGRHWVQNSLGVLAAVEGLGADPEAAARATGLAPGAGRPRPEAPHSARGRRADADRRELQRQPGLDARRARPAGPDAGPAHRRAGRHAGARRPRPGAARGAGRAGRSRRAWPSSSPAAR